MTICGRYRLIQRIPCELRNELMLHNRYAKTQVDVDAIVKRCTSSLNPDIYQQPGFQAFQERLNTVLRSAADDAGRVELTNLVPRLLEVVVTKEEVAAGYPAMPFPVPQDGGSHKHRSSTPPKKGKSTGGTEHRTRSPTKSGSKSMAASGRGHRGGDDDDDDDDDKRRKKRKHAGERDAPADGEPEKRPPRKAKSH